MKKIILLLFFVCISCSIQPKKDYCLKKAEYFPQLEILVPESTIKIYIEDKDSVLQKKVNLETAKKILFYRIKENHRNSFHLVTPEIKSFKIENGVISISVLTAYFRPNIFIDGERRKNVWTSKQIQKVIENKVGLIFEKDTIMIKNCYCEGY